jgi:hypothetical protein
MIKFPRPSLIRIVPFGLYMAFIAVVEGAKLLGLPAPSQETMNWLYPAKIGLAAAAIFFYWKEYNDLIWKELSNLKNSLLSVGVGLVVFALWINLDFDFAIQGELTTYDPYATFENSGIRMGMIISRVAGAVLIVPIMEELFWKSFLVRYLENKDITKVAPGTFTLFSFAGTAALFGLEHQLWLAGIVAGVGYNFLYYKTKSLAQCILSHALTNAVLAGYVLSTGKWYFW